MDDIALFMEPGRVGWSRAAESERPSVPAARGGMPVNELRIGAIGIGGRGGLAWRVHDPAQRVAYVGGADVSERAKERFRRRFAEKHGRAFPADWLTTDYRELLARDDVDAVFVCTPDYLHEEHAVAALQAGKAVYLEKPMAITIEGCDRILRTAYETGSRLYVGHNMRYFESILTMKQIIDAGEIGDIQAAWCRHFVSYGGDAYFKDWHAERRYSTGLLLQKGAHDIDVIHWLAGGYTRRVAGMGRLSVYDRCGKRPADEPGDASFHVEHWPPLTQQRMNPLMDVEDHSMILMQLDNGVQASYLQCHYTPDSTRNYTFIGTRGRIENIGDSEGSRVVVYSRRSNGFKVPDRVHEIGGGMGGHGGSDPRIVQAFIDFVRDGRPPNTSPVAARYAVAAGCMGTESLRDGSTPREIPSLDAELRDYFEQGQH